MKNKKLWLGILLGVFCHKSKKFFQIEMSSNQEDKVWKILMASLFIGGGTMQFVAEIKLAQMTSTSVTSKVAEIPHLERVKVPNVELPPIEREQVASEALVEITYIEVTSTDAEATASDAESPTEPPTVVAETETQAETEAEPVTENISVEEPTTEEEPQETETNIDPEDWYWLAHLIYAENGSNSYRCQLLTGLVAVNRKNRPEYPDTIQGVIFDPGKYAVAEEGTIYMEPSEQAWQIAWDILSGNTEKIPENVVYQAMFPQGSGVFEKVDTEYFCYKN